MSHQKIGGISAILEAVLYIIGIAFLFLFLSPAMDEASSDIENLRFTLENKTLFQVWSLLIYVLFGLLLIPLTIVINENFSKASLIGSKMTPILGFIWSGLVIASGMINNIGLETVSRLMIEDESGALSAWQVIGAIQNGLGGGVEVVGGLWVLLISIFGIRESVFSKSLNYLGLVVGTTGILTVIPGLEDVGLIFGLSQIVWFVWIGLSLIKSDPNASVVDRP